MKSEEFLHILTRVVNSPVGPRFLQIVHELRDLLEEAGIAEDAKSKVEVGKPIRRRSPEKVTREKPEAAPSQPPPEAVESGEIPKEEAPAPPKEAAAAVIGESPSSLETGIPPAEPGEEFVEAAPGHYVRKREAPPAEEPTPAPVSRESVRSIVLSALEEGDKTMAELKDIVREHKGQVSHLNQQIHQALRKIEARKIAKGKFSIAPEIAAESSGESQEPAAKSKEEEQVPSPGEVRQLSILDELSNSAEPDSTPEESQGIKEAPPPGTPS